MESETEERRRRGRRPADARARRASVEGALRELEQLRLPFTMQDVADRAGISRATLYRDAALRDLIGSRGDGPVVRPVDARVAAKLQQSAEELTRERAALRRELKETKKRVEELLERCAALERENQDRLRSAQAAASGGGDEDRARADAYAEGFAAGTRAAMQRGGTRPGMGGAGGLAIAAARLSRPSVVSARRNLARALHPDLFANDPATQVLATEILKQLNSLLERAPNSP